MLIPKPLIDNTHTPWLAKEKQSWRRVNGRESVKRETYNTQVPPASFCFLRCPVHYTFILSYVKSFVFTGAGEFYYCNNNNSNRVKGGLDCWLLGSWTLGERRRRNPHFIVACVFRFVRSQLPFLFHGLVTGTFVFHTHTIEN